MIMLNGKRIDGTVGDALPIGTLSPFVGLVAPKGYLICMGQLVDKAKYPELWELCGDTFGPSTATQFYLPDLRGQVIAGYKQGDATFGTLGALIGGKTTSYTPAGTNTGGSVGNHTLTISEMPSHTHAPGPMARNSAGIDNYYTGWGYLETSSKQSNYGDTHTESTGGNGAHNHGFTQPTFTGTQANINVVQPTAVMNWIIKASMLAVVTGNIEDSLTSTSDTDALSAKQGKVLNDIKINISDIVDNCTTNDASKVLSAKQGKALNDKFGNYVLTSSIVNNLTSTSTNVPLSAAQGKALNDKLTNLSSTTLTASSKITSPSYYMGEYQVFGVKAWAYVKVSGTTPTLVAGGNISSVVRTQVGTYRFTFTKAMPNANYAAVASAECGGVGHEIIGVYQHTTTSVIVDVTDVTPALNDPEEINLIVVG